MVLWLRMMSGTAVSSSIVENTAGSDGVVGEDDVVEGTDVSSSIVENTADSDGVVVDAVWCEGCTMWWHVQ